MKFQITVLAVVFGCLSVVVLSGCGESSSVHGRLFDEHYARAIELADKLEQTHQETLDSMKRDEIAIQADNQFQLAEALGMTDDYRGKMQKIDDLGLISILDDLLNEIGRSNTSWTFDKLFNTRNKCFDCVEEVCVGSVNDDALAILRELERLNWELGNKYDQYRQIQIRFAVASANASLQRIVEELASIIAQNIPNHRDVYFQFTYFSFTWGCNQIALARRKVGKNESSDLKEVFEDSELKVLFRNRIYTDDQLVKMLRIQLYRKLVNKFRN